MELKDRIPIDWQVNFAVNQYGFIIIREWYEELTHHLEFVLDPVRKRPFETKEEAMKMAHSLVEGLTTANVDVIELKHHGRLDGFPYC